MIVVNSIENSLDFKEKIKNPFRFTDFYSLRGLGKCCDEAVGLPVFQPMISFKKSKAFTDCQGRQN
jgi:hypothetical protein